MRRLDGRLELRLDTSTLRLLERLAVERRTSVAVVVREAIGTLLAAEPARSISNDLEQAFALEAPIPSDPAVLARELDSRWGV